MYHELKLKVVTAVWENPAAAFGCRFRYSGRYQENEAGGDYQTRGKIRITKTASGENINVYYNGSSRQSGGLFEYLQDYHLNTANYADTLRTLAGLYHIPIEVSKEEREALNRLHLAQEVAPFLIRALQDNPTGETYRYVTEIRRLSVDGRSLGELSTAAIEQALAALKAKGKTWTAEDLRALGLTQDRINGGYTLVIPYYHNGVIQGFIYRNIRPNLPASTPRYLYSDGLGRLGYCNRLNAQKPAVFVEGQLDAIRLTQVGVDNVIAIGGAKIGGDIARLLCGRGISEVIYCPDHEIDAQGKRKTEIISKAVEAFQAITADGEPLINSLLIADLPAPDGSSKADADSYGADHPQELRGLIEVGTVEAWRWQLDRLREWVAEIERTGDRVPVGQLTDRITKVYICNQNPFTRQRMRDHLNKSGDFAQYGITGQALADLDGWRAKREYNERITAGAMELKRAVEAEATPEQVRNIIRKLSMAQGQETRQEWAEILNSSYLQDLDAIRYQPKTLGTKWELGMFNKAGQYFQTGKIEFYPADISVFCAPTSHGKTMILFEAAADLIKRNPDKLFLFVSCEENNRQLLERAINVTLPIDTTPDGRTSKGGYCFVRNTRKKTIKAAIKGATAPKEYGGYMGVSEHYEALKSEILRGVEAYGRTTHKQLKLIHTEESAESICQNILHYVEAYRSKGVEVGAVFIDYMQLLYSDANTYSRHDELKEICRLLKDCAAKTELPIIIAAQLNREVLSNKGSKNSSGAGIDNITVANIGEGADIERIAHDIYLVWQVDKTPLQPYAAADAKGEAAGMKPETKISAGKVAGGLRSRRLFRSGGVLRPDDMQLKSGYMYVEQLKARDGITGGWALYPFDGERGTIGEIDTQTMAE